MFSTGFSPELLCYRLAETTTEQDLSINSLAQMAQQFAEAVEGLVPNCEEKAIALRGIQNTLMWCEEGIKRHSRTDTDYAFKQFCEEVTQKQFGAKQYKEPLTATAAAIKQEAGQAGCSSRQAIENFLMILQHNSTDPSTVLGVKNLLYKTILKETL